MDFRKTGCGHGKVLEFHFLFQIFLAVLKTRNIVLVIQQNYTPMKAGFSAFFSHGKFKLVMEKSLNFIAQLLCEPV